MNIIIVLLILFYLCLKHYIADFLLQTKNMAIQKGIYGNIPGIWHTLTQILLSMPLLILFWPNFFPLLLEALTHYHMDWFKIWYNKRRQWHPQTKEFWWLLGLDQFVHYTIYLIMIGWWLL